MTLPAVLVIDDDGAQIDRMVAYLRRLKIAVLLARTKEEAVRMAERHTIDLVLLELGLGSEVDPEAETNPGSNHLPALEILEILRSGPHYTPVLVVSYLDKPIYELIATQGGADVFLHKPVDLNLLTAHLRNKLNLAVLLRSGSAPEANGHRDRANGHSILTAGELMIDAKQRLVRVGDGPYQSLTEREVKLLSLLAGNPGRVYGRAELLIDVCGHQASESYDAVDAMIKRIRKKIEPVQRHPRYLMAARGRGFYLRDGGRP
jgi:DNA-binding response OmpR family regulator